MDAAELAASERRKSARLEKKEKKKGVEKVLKKRAERESDNEE